MKKKELIFRIIFVFTFLIVSTLMVYVPKSQQLAASMSFLNNIDRLELQEVTKGIVLSKTYPVSDNVGLNGEDTVFVVRNNNDNKTKYNIKIQSIKDKKDINYLDLSNIKYVYKVNDGEYSEIKSINEDGILDIEELEENTENKYSFKFWISSDADTSVYGSVFSANISLNNIK